MNANYNVRLLNPNLEEKWQVAMSSLFVGKNGKIGFIYIPKEQIAIMISFNIKITCQKLTQELFINQIAECKSSSLKCHHVEEIRIAQRYIEALNGTNFHNVLVSLSKKYFHVKK